MMKATATGLMVCMLALLSAGPAFSDTKEGLSTQTDLSKIQGQGGHQSLLPGNRVIVGTVEEIKGDQIKVNTGEVQPRFLALGIAKEKGFSPIKKGDQLKITLNEQNLVVDYHPIGEPSQERTVRGSLISPLVVGHDQAVIRMEDGKEQSFEVRPLARSKLAGVPIGSEAVFLLDETRQITDVAYGEALGLDSRSTTWQGSPLKGAHRQLPATIVKTLENGKITVRTEDGKEHGYEIRSLAQDKLADVREGQKVILLIDTENKIVDLAAVPPKKKG